MVRRRSALIALRTFSKFSSFRQFQGRSDFGWSSHDIPSHLQREYHSYTSVLLKASCNIETVSAADFPNRKQNFTHTLCSLLSAIIKIAELPSRHLKKSHNNNNSEPRLASRGRLLEYCVHSRHLAAHRATTSISSATFKFQLFLGPPIVYISGFLFLDPEDIRKQGLGVIRNFAKEQGSFNLLQNTGHKGSVLRPIGASGPVGLGPKYYSFIHYFFLEPHLET